MQMTPVMTLLFPPATIIRQGHSNGLVWEFSCRRLCLLLWAFTDPAQPHFIISITLQLQALLQSLAFLSSFSCLIRVPFSGWLAFLQLMVHVIPTFTFKLARSFFLLLRLAHSVISTYRSSEQTSNSPRWVWLVYTSLKSVTQQLTDVWEVFLQQRLQG